jgi:hypothetical protein
MILFIIILIFILLYILFNNKIENFRCESKRCCLKNEYGVDQNCKKCPKERPVSSSITNSWLSSDCICPNLEESSCMPCHECDPFNKNTGLCTPMKCGPGMKCYKGKCVVKKK